MRKYLLLILLSLIIACQNNSSISNENKFDFSDTKWRDLYLTSKGYSEDYKYVRFMLRAIPELDRLDTGYAGLQIRLWYEYSYPEVGNDNMLEHIIVFKKPNSANKWSGSFLSITRVFDSASNVGGFNKKIEIKNPATGWDKFINRILELKIASLPDHTQIGMDNGTHFTVEVADKTHYRLYTYVSPEYYKKDFWQANNIVQIMELIEKEFDFPRLVKF